MQKLILIGSSTGGPGHIEKILKSLPATFSSKIIIAQHMDKSLLSSFAHRLASIAKVPISTTESVATIEESPSVLVCSQTCKIAFNNGAHTLRHIHQDHPTFNPDIDTFFLSAAEMTEAFQILCIILTGIGSDGAKGMLALRKKGVATIAESEESAVVYGMPRSAFELGAADKVLPLDEIIREILRFDSNHL